MPQYHIASNGKPAICRAEQRACPLGGQHYEDEVEALRGALDKALGSVNLLEDADDGNGNGRPMSDTLPGWVAKASVGRKLRKLQDPSVTAEVLTYFAADGDGYVRDAVAMHPNTPTHILQRFLEDKSEDGQVRWLSLAANPSLTVRQQIDLYKGAKVRVRTALVGRPEVTLGLARLVRSDPQVSVRQALARKTTNHNLTHYMLASDPDVNVRLTVAKNPTATRTALQLLVEDDNSDVSDVAQAKLAKLDRYAP